MATINFLYRSSREQAPLNFRLLFTHNGTPIQIGGKTQLVISKDYWQNYHSKQRINDIDLKNEQTEVKKELSKFESYILKSFHNTDIDEVTNDWLKEITTKYYQPEEKNEVSTKLIDFFSYYLDVKDKDLSYTRKQRIRVVLNKLIRFEKATKKKYSIIDVNDNFKKKFLEYADKQQYAGATTKKDFSVIKTICRYANDCGIETHPQLRNLNIKIEQSKAIYLSFEELDKIKKLDLSNNERLNNVRDWLLISCYTGQRISDFMRFTSDMVIKKNDKKLLSFKQQKTSKNIVIPFLEQAQEVYNKRNGNFPRPISEQKYNDYLKELCKLAGINELIQGAIMDSISTSNKKTRNDYRKINGKYEKWQLIGSHVGRRSFATNFYGKVPTSVLIGITGHSTEAMFLNYIQKTESETALDAFKYFEN